MSDWKAAIDEATKSIEALDRLEAPPFTTAKDEKSEDGAGDVSDAGNVPSNDDGVVELPDGDEDEAEALKKIEEKDQRHEDIKRIRTKALMRRARARSEQGGWSNLQGALEGTTFLVHHQKPRAHIHSSADTTHHFFHH